MHYRVTGWRSAIVKAAWESVFVTAMIGVGVNSAGGVIIRRKSIAARKSNAQALRVAFYAASVAGDRTRLMNARGTRRGIMARLGCTRRSSRHASHRSRVT